MNHEDLHEKQGVVVCGLCGLCVVCVCCVLCFVVGCGALWWVVRCGGSALWSVVRCGGSGVVGWNGVVRVVRVVW